MREGENMYDDMYSLAMGPNSEVRSYSGCIINGARFHTIEHDNRRTTQNSGVMVVGGLDKEGNELRFYGVLNEVLDLQYAKGRHLIMFKCRWFDTDEKKERLRLDLGGYTSINTSEYWYVDEPFIFPHEAHQVYYLDDLKFGKSWKVVQVVQNKRLWDVPEVEDLGNEQLELLEMEGRSRVDEYIIQERPLCRDTIEPVVVERQIIQAQLNSGVPSNNGDDFINSEDEDVEVSHDISSSPDGHSHSDHDNE